MQTLGIDLGTNSIGWAVIGDDAVQRAGVLVFEEGVNRDDSLETPAAARRAKRMARRLRFRRHLRRRLILKILIENKMCPLTLDELKAWSQTGSFPKNNTAFLNWLKSTDTDNPYADRAAAASGKVAPEVLGRAVFHISQRRGFKSGRKDMREEGEEKSAAAKELEGMKGEIAALTAELEKSGFTLGQYFYEEIKRGNKVRKRHTGRIEHYEKEWMKIAAVQKLDQVLAGKIARVLFWQRPLREQSFLAGKCPFEPKRNRAQLGHPDFEEFRALSFVNNIRFGMDGVQSHPSSPLTAEQRSVAVDCFIRKSPFSFGDIKKKLEKRFKELKGAVFNYEDTVSLSPSKVTAALREIFTTEYAEHVQTAFNALTFFDDNEKLKRWAQAKLGLSAEASDKFVKIHIPEGRASYSLHAIRKINRFLRKGVELSEAIFLAKLPDVIPDFNAKEDNLIGKTHEHNELYRENKRTAYHDTRTENRVGVLPLEKRLRSWLEEDYGVGGEIFDTLYFRDPKADSSYADVKSGGAVLPPVKLGMIRNPLVQRSMTMLRRLVNELRRKGTIDADTRIHIELARDVNSRNDRMAIQTWQKQNEEARQNAKAKLQEHGIAHPADDLVLKYILAEEQEWKCPYTGKQISINGGGSLFPGFDIEHTIPRSRSGDDSQANKTFCAIDFNRNVKKGLMPSELQNHETILTHLRPWKEKIDNLKKLKEKQAKIAKGISRENAEDRSKARQKLLVTKLELKYWEDKYHRFTKKPDDVTPSFISRQLVDTGIMTRHAVALLKTVYSDVYPVNGVAVAFARKLWKVQGEDEVKDRSDHTHHAKDAMVIAALSRDRFQKICAELKADDEKKNPNFTVAPPMPNFAQKVYNATSGILIKHVTRHNELKQTYYKKPRRLSGLTKGKDGNSVTRAPAAGSTVRGQLHKETFYGKIQKPGETETVCVIREELTFGNFPKPSALEKIVDDAVRKAIQDEIKRRGGDFKKALDQGGFKLPGERGAPIKKVRIVKATVKNPKEVRQHTATPSKHDYKNPYYVESGGNSNFRLAVYERQLPLSSKKETEFIAENLLDYAQNNVRMPKDSSVCIGYILPGTMAIVCGTENENKPLLYKVVAFGNMENERRITLRLHTEARRSEDLSKELSETGKNKKGESSIDKEHPHPLLRLQMSAAWSSFLFEGIHFKMGLDGTIEYLPGTEK